MQLAIADGRRLGTNTGGFSACTILYIALAIFTVGMLCGIWLTRKCYRCVGQTGTKIEAKTTRKTAKNGKRTAITQSMTTYTWWTENPRFKLQFDDGAYHVC